MRGSYIAFAHFDTVNDPPEFGGNPLLLPDAVVEIEASGDLAGFVLDPDWSDVLTFSKVSGPAWLSVAPDGSLSGIPALMDTGTNQFTVRVEDEAGLFDSTILQFEVIGVEAHWKLDDEAGTAAADSSGNGHVGTLENGPTWGTGILGSGLSLDGVDDRVVATGYKGVGGTQSRTVSAWIKTISTNAAIVTWGTNAPGQKFTFRLEGGGAIRLEVNGGSIVGNTTVNDGSWHHVAVVLTDDGSLNVKEARLYVDGAYDGFNSSTSEAINTGASRDVWIGDDFSAGREFEGQLDDVRIYAAALSDTMIAEIYESAVAKNLYQVWAASHGLSGADASYLADTDGDGLNQLGEYGGGGDPNDAASGYLETPSLISGPPSPGIRFQYHRRVDAVTRRIAYRVLASETMAMNTWFELSGLAEVVTALNAEFERVSVTLTMSSLPADLFLRVETTTAR